MKKPLLLILMSLFTFGLTVKAQDEGKRIPFQGSYYENGEPFNGNKTFTFTIDLGDTTWTETQENVQIVEGLYAVILGAANSLPEDLFFDANSRSLTVAVGSTTLGTIDLYAPFALNDGQNFGEGVFRLDARSATDSTALVGEIYGPGNGIEAVAIQGLAQTDTTENIGLWGVANGSELNNTFQTGVYGQSTSSTEGAWSTGVWGIGSGNGGGTTYGIRGEARGTTTFSAAARGLNFSTTPEIGGSRYGGYFNTYTVPDRLEGESIGVRGNGGGSVVNYGVIGEAFSNGEENIGVKGIAYGGKENYSGWFEGAQFLLKNSELKMLAEEIIGDDTTQVDLITAYGSIDEGGNILIEGPSSTNFWIGNKNWKDSNLAYMAMRGAYSETDNEGRPYNPDLLFFEIERNNDNSENGVISLARALDGEGVQYATLDYDKLSSLERITNGEFQNGSISILGNEGGNIYIEGPSSSNFWIGNKNWEDSNLAYMAMRGAYSETDNEGRTYNPDLLFLETARYDDLSENGVISLARAKEGEDIQYARLDYYTLSALQRITDSPDLVYLAADVYTDEETGDEVETGVMNLNQGNILFEGYYGSGFFSGDLVANAFNQTSDRRLKKNITRLTSGLATVQQLRGVRYNWKDESKREGKIGFIAQEVEEVLPELVSTKKDGFKAVNYAEMTAVLVEAVKELSAQIEMLQQENADLKAEVNKVNEMEERLAMIESLLKAETKSINSDQK